MELRLDTGYRQILKMALPISLAMLVPQINFITNNIFLGGLGERELASAGITGVFYLIFAVIGNGLNNGLQSLIARRAGQNLPKEIGRLFYNGVWVALGIAVLGILVTSFCSPCVKGNYSRFPNGRSGHQLFTHPYLGFALSVSLRDAQCITRGHQSNQIPCLGNLV
jgi:Na+-driven multidrug efflux pump